MANYLDMLQRAAFGTQSKTDAVSSAAADKQARLDANAAGMLPAAQRLTGLGAASATPAENLLATGDPAQISSAMGRTAPNAISDQANALVDYTNSQRGFATGEDVAADLVTEVGRGTVNALGGMAAWGTSWFDKDAGLAMAAKVDEANKALDTLNTTNMNERKAAGAVRAALRKRDADKANDGTTMGNLKRIGQGVLDGMAGLTDDSALAGAGVAQAVGSIVAAPTAALATGGRVALGIGAMEGGGAFVGTANEIMKMSTDDLAKNSEHYRALVEQGLTPDRAKRALAWQAAQVSGAIQAPIAAATGKLVSKFEGNPLSVVPSREALANVGREFLEEGAQSASGAIAGNVGKSLADNRQDLLEGVGEQMGEGALLGSLAAGTMQTPSLAAGAVIRGGKSLMAGASAAADTVAARAEKVRNRNAKASPIADDKVAAAAEAAVQAAPAAVETMAAAVDASDAAPEVKAQVHQYVQDIASTVAYDPEFVNQEGITPTVAAALEGSTSRADAIQRLSSSIEASDNVQDQVAMAYALYMQVEPITALQENANEDNIRAAMGSPESVAALQQFDRVLANMDNTPKVKQAYDFVERKLLPKVVAQMEAAPVTEGVTATPEQVQAAVLVAQVAPEKMPAATAAAVLKQAESGEIALTDAQYQSLKVAQAVVEAAKAYDAQVEAAGHNRKIDIVSKQIKTDDSRTGAGEQSAVQHARGIASAMRAGNFDLARERLNDFGAFVDHMGRKVAALNEHFAAGNPNADGVPYMALMPNRSLREAKKPMYVNLLQEKSIELAQQVGFETQALTDIFNGLAGAFDELGVAHKVPVELNPALLADTPRNLREAYVRSQSAAKKQPAAKPKVEETAPKVDAAPTTDDTVARQPVREEVKQDGEPQSTPEVREPAADPVPAVERAEAVAEEVPAVAAEPESPIAAAFPGLIKMGVSKTNWLEKAFKFPAEAKSRLIGEENPIASVLGAFSSGSKLAQFTGKAMTRDFSGDLAKAFRDYTVDTAGGLVAQLEEQMAAKLAEKSGNTTIAQILLDSKKADPQRWTAGKAFNALAQDADGNLFYQPALVEAAGLAGAQWLLTADSMGTHVDAADVAAMTGLPMDQVDHLVDILDEGMSMREAIRSLGQKVADYWGLVPAGKDIAQGYTDGIPMAIGAELLRAMVAQGLVEQKVTHINADGMVLPADTKNADAYRTIYRFVPKGMDKEDVKREFAGAIDHAVLMNPPEQFYFDTAIPPVATSQLRNPAVKLTADQKKALEHDQATAYFVDQDMVNVYRALGTDGVLELFGHGNIDPETTNETHYQSQEGKNRSVVAGFDHMETMLAELEAVAGDRPITEVPVRFGYNFTRVNRMQMLGKHNPQSNKLIREMLLPTWSTLDLTPGSQDMDLFRLGLAQGLGIKVHNVSREVMREQLGKMLSDLAPSTEILRDVLAGGRLSPEQIKELKANFKAAGADLTNVGFHALVDWARLQMADDKSAFRTGVYVEADGVTNGPINAMALMTSGLFTEGWVKNIGKGGMFFGTAEKTMNQHRSNDDSVDMYEASTHELTRNLATLRSELSSAPEVAEQLSQLESLMELFLKDLTFKDGALQMKRGIAKNPLTITIYGSGARGIAGKLVSNVMDEVYEKMSAMLQAQAETPGLDSARAMFGDNADAEAKYDRFWAGMHALLTKKAVYSKKKGQWMLLDTESNLPSTFDPKTFKLDGPAISALTDNMLNLFVGPMVQAINSTVGEGVMDSVAHLRDATQIQSLILEDAFARKVDEMMAEEAKKPEYRKGDFLSREQLQEALDAVLPLAPFVSLDGKQTYFIAGSQNSPVTNTAIAAALDGTFEIEASAPGPANAGVAGIPFMTIGSGDGMMMQDLSTMPGAPGDNLKIFDGVNFRLDHLMDNSRMANQAVYASWQRNPLAAVQKSFAVTLEKLDLANMRPEGLKKLAEAVLGKKQVESGFTVDQLEEAIRLMGDNLSAVADSAEARHRVLSRVAMSVDQMAAAGAPFHNQGSVVLDGSPKEIAAQLNTLLAEEQATMRKAKARGRTSAASQAREGASALDAIGNAGRALKSGVRELSPTALNQVGKALTMSPEQAELFGEAMRGKHLAGWKVVFGTEEQLNAYAIEKGMPAGLNAGDRGVTLPGVKTILLASPTVETLVHEIVHAATYEKVLAAEMAPELNEPATNQAVQRIKALREQFLNGDFSAAAAAAGSDALRSFMDAKAAVLGALRNRELGADERQAIATNEFMAWTLANTDLVSTAKAVAASPLVRLAQAAVAALKKLVWGKAKAATAPGNDVASNLLFNTMVVMRGQMAVSDAVADTALAQNQAYGDDTRLDTINRGFAQALQRLEALAPTAVNPKINQALKTAADAGMVVAGQGFVMSAQQMTTFRNMVAAMASQAKLDANSMAEADALYQHVLKNLEPEHFMANPESRDPGAYYNAKRKYDAVVGNTREVKDALGRETLMPVFLALAVTSPEMREALAKLPVPKAAKGTDGSLDTMLRNAGEDAMFRLGRAMAGVKGNTLSDIADSLSLHAADVAQERANFLSTAASAAGGVIDTVNDKMVEGLQALSDASLAAGDKLAQGNIVEKTGASILRGVAALTSEKNGKAVAEGVMGMANAANLWKPAFDLLNDLSGRTSSNAAVYDLIKLVRSTVQQTRQQFREEVPAIIRGKFSRDLTSQEWADLHQGLGKTDIAALAQATSVEEARLLASDSKARAAAIKAAEAEVKSIDGAGAAKRIEKAKQLAAYMMGAKAGARLLRNASAIWDLAVANPKLMGNADGIAAIDKLVSLYALDSLPATNTTSLLVQQEAEGIDFAISYLMGQRVEEERKAAQYPMAKYNALKGELPSPAQAGVSLVVADDAEFASLAERSYTRVANFEGSDLDRGARSRGYYFAPVSAKAAFAQGIMQNVRMTAGGVDALNGFSQGMTGGRITDPQKVKDLAKWLDRDTGAGSLIPVYDELGKVVALERAVDPAQLVVLNQEKNLASAIGQWRGRQVEEVQGHAFNEVLVDRLADMWERDLADGKKDQYVNLAGRITDPVLRDAVNLLNKAQVAQIEARFGEGEFWVRKDMLDDAMGYRAASVGDAWTGNTRWSDETQKRVQNIAMAAFGNDAYRYMVNSEQVLKNFVADAKTIIVVKSMIVPWANMISNVYQLISRGVPMGNIIRGVPKKMAEVKAYTDGRSEVIQLEADLLAARGNPSKELVLNNRIKAIKDGWTRLSIFPLVQAGEFAAISDASLGVEERMLSEGRLHSYVEALTDRLPESMKTAGKYALITKDTALFQGLQKAVDFGDFLAKAIIFDDLTQRKKMSAEDALARVTEEFVNYDRLPGRTRGYAESIGALWFYNFKIRISKIALSTLRNNPLHALLAGTMPQPSDVGLPLEDNLFTAMAEGRLGNSIGPGMGMRAPSLNPFFALAN